ncbi:MAG: hypothetical protein IKT47_05650 [Oscillospiraceae bacterium]|nr:hypothetical protein [Oscillospiraceae bacterium]
MVGRSDNKENKSFLLFLILAAVFGGLMLLWGQHNSAQQVFEIGFLKYRVNEQLANDTSYVFSEENAVKYNEMLQLAEEWTQTAGGVDKTCSSNTVTNLYGDFAAEELKYTVYDNGSDTTVFLLHGYNETQLDAAIFAPYWWDKGYNVIIPSLERPRGEGASLVTFGVYEQYDIYDIICAENLTESKVILHGRGTGAAAALLISSRADYDCGIDMVVSDSVYATLNGLKIEQLHAQFKLGEFLTGTLLSNIIEKQLGFDITTIEITKAAAANDVPKFFVCGGADNFISKNETYAVYTEAAGAKALLTVEEGANRMAYTASYFGNGEYISQLDKFVDENVK